MAEKNYPEEFEQYWHAHENALIEAAPKVLKEERANNGKMNTAGDWLLFIVPFIVGVGFMNSGLIVNEMLSFIVGLVLIVICYGLTMMLRPYVTGKRSIADIDADIKDYFFTIYEKDGMEKLKRLTS